MSPKSPSGKGKPERAPSFWLHPANVAAGNPDRDANGENGAQSLSPSGRAGMCFESSEEVFRKLKLEHELTSLRKSLLTMPELTTGARAV